MRHELAFFAAYVFLLLAMTYGASQVSSVRVDASGNVVERVK